MSVVSLETQNGRLAQLVRALPSHGRRQMFKSFVAHHSLQFSHYRTETSSRHRFLVLNLLFRSGCKDSFQPLQDRDLKSDPTVGVGVVGFQIASFTRVFPAFCRASFIALLWARFRSCDSIMNTGEFSELRRSNSISWSWLRPRPATPRALFRQDGWKPR